MNWPAPNEYQDVVQNPQICFRDPSLHNGKTATDKIGLPNVASGNFACVFKIQTITNNYAVRCFLREVTDQQHRYELLSQHLSVWHLPSLVQFEYIPKGIQVKHQWFPIVKMEWVDGESLSSFVERNISKNDVLRGLAADWLGVCAGLKGANMAHCDLQHGNVMVTKKGEIKLVDYDPMFIPKLQGSKSPELGHPNYSHPNRRDNDYDDNLDNFSSLVIYLSLRALVVDPSLWAKYHNGDNLILTKSDYLIPSQSACFKMLESNPDLVVQTLQSKLRHYCAGSVSQVPDLASLLQFSPAINTKIQTVPKPSLPISIQTQHRSKPYVDYLLQNQTMVNQPTNLPPSPNVITCPRCKSTNDLKTPDGLNVIWCRNCLAPLNQNLKKCPKCGNKIPQKVNYCTMCGKKQ